MFISERKSIGASHKALYVTLAVVILSMIPGIFISGLKPLTYIAALVYIAGERKNRGYSWTDFGIKFRDFKKDFLDNWHLFLIVAVVLQLPVPLIARAYWPDLINHISERIPFFDSSSIITLVLIIILIPLVEELIYRGLLQQRLAWYLNGVAAVIIASVVFGIQHFTPGTPAIVAVDLAGVAIDGMFFGWIFSRCHNVLISWPAHVAADLVGLAILLYLV